MPLQSRDNPVRKLHCPEKKAGIGVAGTVDDIRTASTGNIGGQRNGERMPLALSSLLLLRI